VLLFELLFLDRLRLLVGLQLIKPPALNRRDKMEKSRNLLSSRNSREDQKSKGREDPSEAHWVAPLCQGLLALMNFRIKMFG